MAGPILAVTIGGSRLGAAVVDQNGDVVVRDRIGMPQRDVWMAVRRLVLRVLAASSQRPVGCGVAVVGAVHAADRMVSPTHIPSWIDFPLGQHLEDATQVPVVIDTDARAIAMGEAWCGGAVGVDDFVGVVIGATVGGGLVSGGSLLGGRMGQAGNIGHVVVEPGGRQCGCGATGCLDAYCGGAVIERDTGRSALRAPAAVIERSGLLVGRAVANVAVITDIRVAVVAGTIPLTYGAPFFDAANAEVAARVKLPFLAGLAVVPSPLGPAASLVGAAALARHMDR